MDRLPHLLALFDIFSGSEMTLILVAVLLLFGGEKMPEFARGLGKIMREFRKAASEVEYEIKRAMDEAEHPPPKAPAIRPAPATLPRPAELPAESPPPPPPEEPGGFENGHPRSAQDDISHGLE